MLLGCQAANQARRWIELLERGVHADRSQPLGPASRFVGAEEQPNQLCHYPGGLGINGVLSSLAAKRQTNTKPDRHNKSDVL
jgi:hypothetical protein